MSKSNSEQDDLHRNELELNHKVFELEELNKIISEDKEKMYNHLKALLEDKHKTSSGDNTKHVAAKEETLRELAATQQRVIDLVKENQKLNKNLTLP